MPTDLDSRHSGEVAGDQEHDPVEATTVPSDRPVDPVGIAAVSADVPADLDSRRNVEVAGYQVHNSTTIEAALEDRTVALVDVPAVSDGVPT